MIDRPQRAIELQKKREALDRSRDDNSGGGGGKPVVLSPDWGDGRIQVPV